MAIALANSRDGEGRLSMASPSQWSSFDQHQREMRTGRGNPWGSCAPLLVADYQPQDRLSLRARAGFTYIQNCSGFCRVVSPRSVLTSSCELGADFGRRPFHQNSHRLPVLPRSSRQRVRFSLECTRVHSLRLADCSPLLRNSLAHKQVVQAVAYGPHLSRLSSVARLVGIQPNERRLTNAQRSFAPGAKAND